MYRVLRILAAAALVAISIFGAMAPAASATILCPPSPTPGSTVHGNVEVSGRCALDNVTVDGSVTVDHSSQLFLQNGAVVTGGITVGSSGFLQVAYGSQVDGAVTLNGADNVTIASSALSHGLSGSAGTVNIYSSSVNGAVSADTHEFFLCGSQVGGPVQATSAGTGLQVGDPDDGVGLFVVDSNAKHPTRYSCGGNTITGSLTVLSGGSIIEANKIGGALTLRNVPVELDGNNVGGMATCTDITLLAVDSDHSVSNAYSGANHGCP